MLDEAKLKADLDKYLPVLEMVVSLVPGESGTNIVALLKALDSDAVLTPVVNLANQVMGAH